MADDAIVDASAPANVAERRYRTLQEAYNSLPTDPEHRSIVEVRQGLYEAALDAVSAPKKVAWIGHGIERSRGNGGAILIWKGSNSGLRIGDDMYFDRIIIDGASTEMRPRPAMVLQGNAAAEVRC